MPSPSLVTCEVLAMTAQALPRFLVKPWNQPARIYVPYTVTELDAVTIAMHDETAVALPRAELLALRP